MIVFSEKTGMMSDSQIIAAKLLFF